MLDVYIDAMERQGETDIALLGLHFKGDLAQTNETVCRGEVGSDRFIIILVSPPSHSFTYLLMFQKSKNDWKLAITGLQFPSTEDAKFYARNTKLADLLKRFRF